MLIGIVDDHKIVRDGLKMLLPQNEFSVTLEAENGADMIEKIKGLTRSKFPDVFIIDVNMPVMDGFETVSWLRSKYPNVNVIILSMKDDSDSVLRMVRLGVKSYLPKISSIEELLNAIRIVYEQKFYFPEEITNIIVKGHQQNDSPTNSDIKLSSLSEREIQILKLFCTEKTYQEIAGEMNISSRTVDGYKEALFRKLRVKSRVGLVFTALKNNLV
jgi:DNA-binding NarL/FixJ family response regulator